jgi:uncharacterized repeat protein (TIGR04076 family)
MDMVETHRIKITVLKRFEPSDVFKESPVTPVGTFEACELYEDEQEFVIEKDLRIPDGFCQAAWHTIYGTVRTLAFGGNLPWHEEKGVAVVCCFDGLRPVVFKLERIQ